MPGKSRTTPCAFKTRHACSRCRKKHRHLAPTYQRARHVYLGQGQVPGLLADQKRFMSRDDYKPKNKRLTLLIDDLEEMIHEINEKIDALIKGDETLARQQELLLSIDGVG
jgi:hypothetical protein